MKMKIIVFSSLLIILFACDNEKQENLELTICDDIFTYTDCVKQIIDNNCIVCHHSGIDAVGPFPLETYLQVKDKTENGNVLERIQLQDGDNGLMPQTGKMTQANIDVILSWAESNYEE